MGVFENTNGLEGVRLLLGCIGIALALWGLLHAEDGQFAYALPVRRREIRDRRMLMGGHILIHLVLGIQSVLVASTPDVYPLSTASITGNLSLIATLLVMVTLALRAIHRWSEYEEVVGQQPFTPTTDERLTEAARIGRPMVHAALGDLQIVATTLDLLATNTALSPDELASLDVATGRIQMAAEQIGYLQMLVRGLGPATNGGQRVPPAS